MRTKEQYKKISVHVAIYNKLIEDRNNFQSTIGGGKWSISDTISYYIDFLKVKK